MDFRTNSFLSDLREGKRNFLRLGKRSVPNLRLGKRAIPKMRLGKRSGMTAATLRYLIPPGKFPPTWISPEMTELLKHPHFVHQLMRHFGKFGQLYELEKRPKNAIRIVKKEDLNNYFDNDYGDDEEDDYFKEEEFN